MALPPALRDNVLQEFHANLDFSSSAIPNPSYQDVYMQKTVDNRNGFVNSEMLNGHSDRNYTHSRGFEGVTKQVNSSITSNDLPDNTVVPDGLNETSVTKKSTLTVESTEKNTVRTEKDDKNMLQERKDKIRTSRPRGNHGVTDNHTLEKHNIDKTNLCQKSEYMKSLRKSRTLKSSAAPSSLNTSPALLNKLMSSRNCHDSVDKKKDKTANEKDLESSEECNAYCLKQNKSKLGQRMKRHKTKTKTLSLDGSRLDVKVKTDPEDQTEKAAEGDRTVEDVGQTENLHILADSNSDNKFIGEASSTFSLEGSQNTSVEQMLGEITDNSGEIHQILKKPASINTDKPTKTESERLKTCAESNTNLPSKEDMNLNPEKQNRRICSKCGKELIRKKICYDCELTCKYCGKSYASYKTRGRRCLLLTHLKSHEGDKPYVCDVCGKSFSHVDYMKRHMKLVHVDTDKITFLCKICTKTFKNNHTLQIHIRSIHNSVDQTCKCGTCGAIFKHKSSLRAHLRRVHVETKNYKCEECGLMLKTADSLRAHKKTVHTPRVRTVCYICGAMLLSEDKLKKHIMRHNNKRMFQCTKCEKKFYTSHEVRQHFRTHTGEKPFKCHLCTYACAVKGNLTKHMKKHKDDNWVPGHNYVGTDYSFDCKENHTEFVKLDNGGVDVDEEEPEYSSEILEQLYTDQVEQKVYQQL